MTVAVVMVQHLFDKLLSDTFGYIFLILYSLCTICGVGGFSLRLFLEGQKKKSLQEKLDSVIGRH